MYEDHFELNKPFSGLLWQGNTIREAGAVYV